ncbi:hypothetical protein BASA81_002246 [Batrachochytrium salamandrivorans]|nr:hypothetical protein BASA81_002246 [Batrachochytrium salamandrivorans]
MRQLVKTALPDVLYYRNAISLAQAEVLAGDYESKLLRKKYEGNHFDSVIRDYKEIELPLRRWSSPGQEIIQSLFDLSFSHEPSEDANQRRLLPPHVLELKPETGEILPHLDSIKHGGGVVAVLSLLSVRRLVLTEPAGDYVVKPNREEGKVIGELDVEPLSLYVLHKTSRYEMSHAISPGKHRRISIVFRDEPTERPSWL